MLSCGSSGIQRGWAAIKPIVLFIPWEVVWLLYVGVIQFLLPLVARSQRRGTAPQEARVFCVTHVGGFDPLFVVRESRRWRMKALFVGDDRYPLVNFLFQAVWRFRVTQLHERKSVLNPQTMDAVVRYVQRGGSVMIFPEGHRFWEKKLYPGVAQIAYRAQVPFVVVGLENAYVYRPGAEGDPLLRALARIIRGTRRHGRVRVRFGAVVRPDPSRPETEDVDRMMCAIERWFGQFYHECYGMPGPRWSKPDAPS